MTIRTFTPVVANQAILPLASSTGLARRQPENIVDFSSASKDGLRFTVSVLDTVGSAESWTLYAAFQQAQFGVLSGAPNTSWAWFDVADQQKEFMLPEGDFGVAPYEATNLSPNSKLETGADGWSQVAGADGNAVGSYETGEGYAGPGFRKATWNVATTQPSGGQGGPLTPVTQGQQMTFGMAVKESRAMRGRFGVRWNDGTYTWGQSRLMPADQWQYGGMHVTVPSGKTQGRCVFEASGTDGVDGSVNRQSGDWQAVDAHFVAEGHVPINYIDGTGEVPGVPFAVASSADVLPSHSSRVIRGFGRFAAVRFWFSTVGASSDFGLRLSITSN